LLSVISVFSFLALLDPAFFNSLFECGIWRFWILIFVRSKNVCSIVLILLISYVLKRIEIDIVDKIVRPVPKIIEEISEILSSISIIYNL
jgi:hypothetical protein